MNIEKIEQETKQKINYYKEINSTHIHAKEIENHNHGYPHLGYPWNKYLLCSIVSIYFSDEFEVVNVTDKYGTEEYIIKPCK